MSRSKTVRITDEGFPAGLVINYSEFDESRHTLFEESEQVAPGPESEADELPEGYRIKRAGGPYVLLFAPGGGLIEGPANEKWNGRAAAIEAAVAHAQE